MYQNKYLVKKKGTTVEFYLKNNGLHSITLQFYDIHTLEILKIRLDFILFILNDFNHQNVDISIIISFHINYRKCIRYYHTV